jgi:hypothetical protein
VTLRPIGPRDAGVLQAYVRGLSPESRYDRFFGTLSELPLAELDRVIHLDQKYQLALLDETRVDGSPVVIGEARFEAASGAETGSIRGGWPVASRNLARPSREIVVVPV